MMFKYVIDSGACLMVEELLAKAVRDRERWSKMSGIALHFCGDSTRENTVIQQLRGRGLLPTWNEARKLMDDAVKTYKDFPLKMKEVYELAVTMGFESPITTHNQAVHTAEWKKMVDQKLREDDDVQARAANERARNRGRYPIIYSGHR
jgi:hypothetical protein